MRIASHLGYRPPYEPLFRASVGLDDPLAHIAFAARHGFAGVLDAATRRRSADEQSAIGEALRQHGLQAGCLLYTEFTHLRHTAWSSTDASSAGWVDVQIGAAVAAAKRLGARHIAVLAGAQSDLPIAPQMSAFAQHLRRAGDAVARADLRLVIETINSAAVPGMLLHRLDDALGLLHEVDHPAVRLIFDTGHVAAMDGDVLTHLQRAWPWVEVVQIADQPGRVEPGAGQIDLKAVFDWIAARDYRGLVELEHGWSAPGREVEARALQWLAPYLGCA